MTADTKPETETLNPALDAYYWARYERDAPGGEKRLAKAEAALLAALTPTPSAEDVAVLDTFEDAVACIAAEQPGPPYTETRAAVLSRMAGKVPDGWKLVPVEPTKEMEAAGWIDKEDVCPCDIYAAMLAAAPETPR